jgi:hypothetical protein
MEQSMQDKNENLTEVAGNVAAKLAAAPETITKEEADLAHSREQRAQGFTEKGGLAAKAQSQAARNGV